MSSYQSVLELIPSKRFHSAIVTGYSFDFYFFEEIMLGQLRRAGVTNCLVMVDQNMLEQSLGRFSTGAKTGIRGYSLSGISSKGAFHPKLIFLAGREEGMLIIGSGNPTGAGYGGNLELWGAVSVVGSTDVKAPLMRNCWEYLQGFRSEIGGQSALRFDWIRANSKWIEKVEQTDQWLPLSDQQQCRILTKRQGSYVVQLKQEIGNRSIKRIEILSPFFDPQLKVIQDLNSFTKTAELIIYLQSKNTNFPFEAFRSLKHKPRLVDLNGSLNLGKEAPFSHAKAIQITTDSNSYLLVGSANASVAALGGVDCKPINEELCWLLESNTKDFFGELGLRDGELIEIDDGSDTAYKDGNEKKSGTRVVQLTALDVYESRLEICGRFVSGSFDRYIKCQLRLFDGDQNVVFKCDIDCEVLGKNGVCNLKVNRTELSDALYGQLFSEDVSECQSNVQLVHHVSDIVRGDPDPINRRLEQALMPFETGEEDIFDFVRLLDLNLNLTESDENQDGSTVGAGVESESTFIGNDNRSDSGERLDYKEFKGSGEVSESGQDEAWKRDEKIQRIYEALSLVLKHPKTEAVLTMTLEEEESGEITESFEGTHNDKLKKDFDVGEDKAKILRRRIKRLLNSYNRNLEQLTKSRMLSVVDLTRFCIVSRMCIRFAGTPVLTAEKHLFCARLLVSVSDPFECDSICGLVFNIIGRFSRMVHFGSVIKRNDYEKRRVDELLQVALYDSLFLLALLPEKYLDPELFSQNQWNNWMWTSFQNIVGNSSKELVHIDRIQSELEKRWRIGQFETDMSTMVQRLNRLFKEIRDINNSPCAGEPFVGAKAFLPGYGFVVIKSVEPRSNGELKVVLSGTGFKPQVEINEFKLDKSFIWPKVKLKVFAPKT